MSSAATVDTEAPLTWGEVEPEEPNDNFTYSTRSTSEALDSDCGR